MNSTADLDVRPEYTRLITVFYATVDSKRGTKLPANDKWLFDAETLAVKIYYHIASILHLSFGTVVPGREGHKNTFFDHASINVLARVALETYLTFFFIYCDSSCGIEERKLRHSVWKLSAPTDRQGFNVLSEAAVQALAVEKQYMEKIMGEIEGNPVFLAMKETLRKKARNGEWRFGKGWADLADIAGFAEQTFRSVYSYLCSYAHAGGLSGVQIGQAITKADQKRLSTVSLHLGLLVMSHFLFSYTSLFPETRRVLEGDDEGYTLANKWFITWKEDGFKKTFS
jgi:hypothetical protein